MKYAGRSGLDYIYMNLVSAGLCWCSNPFVFSKFAVKFEFSQIWDRIPVHENDRYFVERQEYNATQLMVY